MKKQTLLKHSALILLAAALLATPGCLLMAAINSGAAFLKIGTGARPSAMGGAYTAIASDVDAMYYNPGGLANLTRRELGATHAEWLLDTRFDFLGYAHPTQFGTFGLGVTRLAAGNQDGRDANRQATGSFEASDAAYTASFSRAVTPGGILASGRTSLGVNLKYLQSRIGAYSAETVAFDLGAQHQLSGTPLSLGMSVLNIGKGMQFLQQVDPLPLTVSAGAAYRFGGTLNIVLDVRHEVYDKRTDVGVGTEYALLPSFALRAGYASQFSGTSGSGTLASLGGLGAGFGINMRNYRADYTFTPFGDLGNVQRISLGARF
ncbi:MAG: PorV/PorQ family protein [Elusimicrobiota bacterium]